jgi:hypothetical protein
VDKVYVALALFMLMGSVLLKRSVAAHSVYF